MNKENKSKQENCNDKHCPFHGAVSLRGRSFQGKIIKTDLHKTVTIEFPRQFYLKKYERYEKKRSRIKAHNPPCINAQIGDTVKIMETKPISKTKNFIIIEKCNQ
jgi:small subunit ribosomal protein S17